MIGPWRADRIERLLAPGERVRLEGEQHWIAAVAALVRRAVQAAVVLLAVKAAHAGALERLLSQPWVLQLTREPLQVAAFAARVGFWLFMLVVLAFALDLLRWRTTRYVVTDQRVLNLSGVFVGSDLETPLERIGDVLLLQSLVGERLDYGDVVLLRTAEEGNAMVRAARPLLVKSTLQAARDGRVRALRGESVPSARAAAHAADGHPGPDGREVQRMLREIATLRDEGVLTAEEFEAKKGELLERL